ncbi:hypothetical protein HAX54_052160, partial [Datura stramonium]|nr:hypothetical protein [Datura stramonium]
MFKNEVVKIVMFDLYSGRVKGIGREEGGLYIFKGGTSERKDVESKSYEKMVAVVYLMNIMPFLSSDGKSPYELLYFK